MKPGERSSGGRVTRDLRARRPPHRPGSRPLPLTHPAVRHAARHVGGWPSPRGRRPGRTGSIRRSLSRYLDGGFRPDIEGLRAIAVLAVIVFHAQLFPLPGGFIGVDVFFVVSGFLITRLILSELSRTGRL